MSRLPARLFLKSLRKIEHGQLELTLPDGDRRTYGHTGPGTPPVRVKVHDWRFFRRVMLGGETGAGYSYILGEWSCDDLVGLVRFVIANSAYPEAASQFSWLGAIGDRVRHRLRRNTTRRARRNISEHYDLSNQFFQIWLDPSMTYSCAYFDHPGQSLIAAQRKKYEMIAEKAGLQSGDHVLEIGCGWGGFAEFAARVYGCRVTGITISEAQAAYARKRIRRAGLEDRVRIELRDYRSVRGRYDKIVSIEMLEAVGDEYLPVFFGRCDELLARDGIAVIQVITLPDQRHDRYRRRPDYIQRYIFPGSHLPSLEAITRALARHTTLVVDDLCNIGDHYAATLRCWRDRFLEGRAAIHELGFDEQFLRRWEFYLAYCEGGFAERYISNLQIVLTRVGNLALRRRAQGSVAPAADTTERAARVSQQAGTPS